MCTRVFNSPQTELEPNQEGFKVEFDKIVNDSILVTGRNMDWKCPMDMDFYITLNDQERVGLTDLEYASASKALSESQFKKFKWKSKYRSVVAVVGSVGSSDGINTEGLVANLLYQSDCHFPEGAELIGTSGLSVLSWAQYVLDCFGSVKEVVNHFQSNPKISIIGALVPGKEGEESKALLHLSVSDKYGDSAILEVGKDGYSIYHNPTYRVMTNEPVYKKQLLIDEYWTWQWSEENPYKSQTLPGTPFPADRFAKASYYIERARPFTVENPTESDAQNQKLRENGEVAQMFSIMSNSSVPLGFDKNRLLVDKSKSVESPNISPTIWTTVSAHKSLVYYFRDTTSPTVLWIDLSAIVGKPIESSIGYLRLKKTLSNFSNYLGEVSPSDFEEVHHLPFLAPNTH